MKVALLKMKNKNILKPILIICLSIYMFGSYIFINFYP